MSNFRFPLQVYPWTFLDRIKIALFCLNKKNRLSMGPKVAEYEKLFENFAQNEVKAVAVSSGSQANHLMLETWLQTTNIDIKNVTFFCCATTWASNLSPILMRGGNVELIDINKEDFSFDYKKLELALKRNKSAAKVIWTTALIGFSPNIGFLKYLADKYDCELFADLCEATGSWWNDKPLISCFDMATTSTFLAHFTSSIEGGFLFINKDFRDYHTNAQLIRNHGLTRVLDSENLVKIAAEKNNPNIDPEFLFEKIGTNMRMTDLAAYYGILDFKRFEKYLFQRWRLWTIFLGYLNDNFYKGYSEEVSPFCLPIIAKKNNLKQIKEKLKELGWESRPIICNMSVAPAYKHLAKRKKFPVSDWLQENGCYVGLNNHLKEKDIIKLCQELNAV